MLTTVLPRRGAALALVLDAVAVLVFAAVGRRSHGEGGTGLSGALAGLAHTAWPFLVALALGWALVAVTTTTARRPRQRDLRAVAPAGVVVWATTVLVGHALRLVSGQGSAVSFLVVTAVVLAALLLGWRALVGLFGRASRSPHGPHGQH